MIKTIIASLIVIGATIIMVGCASTGEESDIPWGAPAGWEGSPFIPGLSE